MTDYHVHIGQWFDTYYEAETVFSELKTRGIDELWFSSTTSCRYCQESIAVKENADLQKRFNARRNKLPTARQLYELIRYEVQEALSSADSLGIKAHPLYWGVPEVHFSDAATVELAMSELPYEGFKIHPRANVWNLDDERTASLAEEVFSYADSHGLLVLIHCGESEFELPVKFEPFIARHPGATVQLAHCRPLSETLYMLKTYPNTVCDSAFASEETLLAIRSAGFADRIRYGSDYPIQEISTRMKKRRRPPISPLYRATSENDIDTVRALLKAGADPNECNHLGFTALMHAAAKNYKEIAALLIAHGADINTTDITGFTALDQAVHRGSLETADLLKEKANV